MILDTSFLIDVLRGDESVDEWEREIDERRAGIVTSITVMELWEGIHRTEATDEERERVRELLEGLTHVDFDRESAMRAGEISATLAQNGERIEAEDVMIAAIALERDHAVLTGNMAHFDRIDGLEVESY